jgi:hypothetical protein
MTDCLRGPSWKPSSQVEVKEGTPRDKPFKGITTQINLAELSRTITKPGPCSFGGCYYMLLLAGFTSHIRLLGSKRSRKCNPQSVINWNTPLSISMGDRIDLAGAVVDSPLPFAGIMLAKVGQSGSHRFILKTTTSSP